MKLTDIGSRIKFLRKEHGFTQVQFADVCGFDRTYLSRVEKGRQNITMETFLLMCEKLEISPKDFFLF